MFLLKGQVRCSLVCADLLECLIQVYPVWVTSYIITDASQHKKKRHIYLSDNVLTLQIYTVKVCASSYPKARYCYLRCSRIQRQSRRDTVPWKMFIALKFRYSEGSSAIMSVLIFFMKILDTDTQRPTKVPEHTYSD